MQDFPEILTELLRCHSTPGDEDAVARVLAREWRAAGWTPAALGRYAMMATRPSPGSAAAAKPRLLVCAHLDSPGYAVERVEPRRLKIIPLGSPRFAGDETAGVLKADGQSHPVTIRRVRNPPADSGDGEEEKEDEFYVERPAGSGQAGDRICFAAEPEFAAGGEIRAPFLDNRVGCALLVEIARRLARPELPVDLVLGATGCEEMGGFGARVLAAHACPDAVVCIDATYEAPEQGVVLGGGPVLTLSDASVLLGTAVRDFVVGWFAEMRIPLQTEVYNYSGTDARAFPQQGLAGPVLPLLIPSRGNHSPTEVAQMADLEALAEAIVRFATLAPLAQFPNLLV